MNLSFNFDLVSFITLLIGLLLCFSGYRLRKFGVAIIWFAIGYTIANMIATNYVSEGNALLTINIAAGIILGVCGYSLEKIGIYIAVGLMTFQFVYNILPYSELINILIAVACGIILAAIAVAAIKPITIIVTALGGSSLFIQGAKGLMSVASNEVFLVLEILFIVLGIVYQFKTNEHSD